MNFKLMLHQNMQIVAFLLVSILLVACGSNQAASVGYASLSLLYGGVPGKTAPATSTEVTWPAFDGGGSRRGVNTAETTIKKGNVGNLIQNWQQTLPDIVDGSPVEIPQVTTSSGVRDLLFVTTKSGSLIALDANSGVQIWRRDNPPGGCFINKGTTPCYTTSSPAIDPSGQFVYSYGLDGFAHKYAVGSGLESTGNGWPELITLKPFDEKGGSSLNIGNGYLYMTTGGYPGDNGDYQGHVVAINLSTGTQTVFNALCVNQPVHFVETPGTPDCPEKQAGIWARAGVVIDPVNGKVFVTTGNGLYDANNGGADYGDSVMELSARLTTLIDTYTPANYQELQNADLDLGSTAPVMLPQQSGSTTPYLTVQSGKDAMLRLLNRQNLSGQGGPAHVGGEIQAIPVPQGGEVLTQPAVWNSPTHVTWVFVANDNGLSALKVVTGARGHSKLQVVYHNGNAGSSPFLADGILFVQGNGVIHALNPETGTVLWSAAIGPLHWQSPIVVNGHLYIVDNAAHISCYGLTTTS